MPSTSNKLNRLFFRLSLFISIVVGISLPTVSGLITYNALSKELVFKARIKADAQKDIIMRLPQTWMFAENQMQGTLAREPVLLENEFIQIFDNQGNELTSAGEPIQEVSISRSYPLYDIDQEVGKVVVSVTLSRVVYKILISSVLGLLLGVTVFSALWLVPIKKLRELSGELFEEKQQAEVTLQSIRDAVFRTDEKGTLVYLNAAAEKLIGQPSSTLHGKPISDFLTLIEDQTKEKVESVIYKSIKTKQYASCQQNCSLLSNDNQQIAVEEKAIPLLNDNEELIGSVLCLSDVTIFRDQLKRRSWEASHDPLTGLLNRREFEKMVSRAIERAQTDMKTSLLFFMDLDGFKIVNDTCGHTAGDELLIQLSKVISSHIRTNDLLARLGGDEFGLLLEGCDDKHGQIIANNILRHVKDYHFFHDGSIHSVGISIGMTSFSSGNYNVDDIICEADSACCWAKESGRHRLCIFQENKAELIARRDEISWIERIKSALEEDRFTLYYQTYKNLSNCTDSRQHLEILIRMVSEEGDIIPPRHFFPAAERYNLMPQIDKWVINRVFSIFHTIETQSESSDIMVNINLSGASINSPELYDFIKEKIAKYNIDTRSLCFEITETVAVRNLRIATDFIRKCKEIGIQFALDDFGSGASFFGYLKNMPVDYLKIDGSFIQNIEKDQLDREMTEAINRIGHLLGKKTIAEFAENKAIIEILNDIGVDFAQGFGVCKPQPLPTP